jgi:phosphatidylserine/phosphatidylglycerophosphate/cardiolipin synthase-like enzyme
MYWIIYLLTVIQIIFNRIDALPFPAINNLDDGITVDLLSRPVETQFIEGIENFPLVLGNHQLDRNSLQGSVYELLHKAQSSILMLSFTFSDPEVIKIINHKASEGIDVQLIIDRDHLSESKNLLHPSIKVGTREQGEGHLHHKILVVDYEYVWLGSANFTSNSFKFSKNLAIGFFSPEMGAALYQEALDIASSNPRQRIEPLSCSYGDQQLELYILPHDRPEAPGSSETKMNEMGKQKLLSLIASAKHHIKISVDVWTYKDVSRAVIQAKQRGIQIDVVVGNTADEAVKMLIQHNIPVKQGRNLHQKFILIDDETLLNGSMNWSMNAFSRNDESFIVLYKLIPEQLEVLKGALKAAGLPIAVDCNNQDASSDRVLDFYEEEVKEKLESINRTITALNAEINQTPTSQEHKRLIAIAKRLSNDLVKFIPYLTTAPLPGCCLYEGERYLANVVAIAEKQERVEAAIKYIKNADGIDQKVYEYFQKTLSKLQQGINVPLPDYFHATRAGFESIMKSQTILQSQTGLTGPGVYMSCNNEGDHGYGTHAFAIDEGCLIDTKGIFRTGRTPQGNVFFSLWASVLKDISITEDHIAFIDTSTDDIPYVTALLEEHNLNIDVVDRETSEAILRIFDLTTKRRELPSFFWNKHSFDDYLPQNMYPRSEQGTFRPFTFSL